MRAEILTPEKMVLTQGSLDDVSVGIARAWTVDLLLCFSKHVKRFPKRQIGHDIEGSEV
jgi:hypothetical protein